MPRLIERLSRSDIKKARAPGLYPDGNGLYLQVTERGTKSWVLLYKYRKRRRKMGLGPLRLVDLAEARNRQGAAYKQLLDGVDPLALRAKRRAKAATAKTFRDAARQYISDHEAKWKNPKHVAQWYMTLLGETREGEKTENNYCAPLHGVSVAEVDTALVLSVLRPIWYDKPETASRLRGRIETVLGWAMVNGLRTEGVNPARWPNHLQNALPEKREVREVKHHAAPPYQELPDFMVKLKRREGLAARALQLAILTAVRTGDLFGNHREERPPMKREHVDLAGRVWTIPQTKTSITHRVPLSDAVVDLLTDIFRTYPDDGSGIVFVGDRPGQPMSSGAMLRVRDRMVADGLIKQGTVTPHGVARACFKSWAGDETNFEKDIVEACLTHVISDKLEAAYRRSDFFAKRTRLMAAWADFVTGKVGANVLKLHA
jgi:Arm DNA-binding domain